MESEGESQIYLHTKITNCKHYPPFFPGLRDVLQKPVLVSISKALRCDVYTVGEISCIFKGREIKTESFYKRWDRCKCYENNTVFMRI